MSLPRALAGRRCPVQIYYSYSGCEGHGIHVCAIVYTDQYVLAVEHVQTSNGMCRQIRHIGREGEIPKEAPLDRLYSSQINSSFKSPAAHARLPVSVAMEPEDRSRRIIKKLSAMPAYISLSRALHRLQIQQKSAFPSCTTVAPCSLNSH
jgi:hypothetical protein